MQAAQSLTLTLETLLLLLLMQAAQSLTLTLEKLLLLLLLMRKRRGS